MNKKLINGIGIAVVYVILFVFIVIGVMSFSNPQSSQEMSYSQFLAYVDSKQIDSVEIEDSGSIEVILKDKNKRSLYAPNLVIDQDNYAMELSQKGINVKFIKGIGSSWWLNIISYILPILFLIFLYWLMLKPMSKGPQGVNFTKSPAKKYEEKEKVTFNDVAGIDEAREELQDIVDYLKNPKNYTKMGARMPKGVLLVGSPGTGKTLVARAVAGEAGVPFFFISGSDFVELFVGVGAARVRDLFAQAKAGAPAIIFIDEIDAVGRQRGAGLGGGHDEREQTLNQLLVEMDGFDSKTGIVLMAATNRPDILDKALLRPGRFDKKIVIDSPDVDGREAIIKIHMRGKPIGEDVEPNILARRTPGFVGADLENLVNEAALLALRASKNFITMDEFEEAIDRVIAGPSRKSRLLTEKEKKIVAYHELGHAVLGYLLPNTDPVHKITIVPRGTSALGYTLQLPAEQKYLQSKKELHSRLIVLLGGRAAEEIIFDDITSGAGNDLKRATEITRALVCQLGMSEKVGPVAWGEEEGEVFLGRELTKMKNYSEETASEIDFEIKRIILDSYNNAKKMIMDNRERIDLIAQFLLEVETISGEQFKEIMERDVSELKIFIEQEILKHKGGKDDRDNQQTQDA